MLHMKREIYIFSVLGVFTCLLLLYQYNNNRDKPGHISSKIESLKNIHQLCINVKCNVFLVEGEEQNILVEGPGKELRHIQALSNNGCFSITRERDPFLAAIFNIFNIEKNNINIYITIKDLDNIKLSYIDELKNIRYISGECLGLILSRGQKLVIESKFLNSCV
jgi:hypothetical protein